MEVSLQIVQMARTNIKILFMFPQV
jgi:hypothetical protein